MPPRRASRVARLMTLMSWFPAFVDGVAENDVKEGLGAEVLQIDVAGGVFGAFVVAGVVGGGGVPVAVIGKELIGGQFGKRRRRGRPWCGRGLGWWLGDAGGGGGWRGHQRSWSGPGFGGGWLGGYRGRRDRWFRPPEETGAEVVVVGKAGAVTGQMARDGEVQQGL